MEAADGSMTVMDGVDTVDMMDSGSPAAHGGGTEETANSSLEDKTAEDEDTTGGRVHNMRDVELGSADTVSAEGDSADLTPSMEISDVEESMDTKEDSSAGESDSDCASESTCLEAMTSSGQEHYLRLGDTPRRRSALRLSRIIARKQLLRKLSQGRNWDVIVDCQNVSFVGCKN